ncbi:hypothetical protein TNCT_38381 [Trichonephila clavata]|uniref:Uncharacterized protein n=1 Tax=Trichonephila clavata TaxID=2740835 RepID=A0A8X6GG05_TRICU|nr:hypothetical protein TNCT_38381 [Trichonephila clavata]
MIDVSRYGFVSFEGRTNPSNKSVLKIILNPTRENPKKRCHRYLPVSGRVRLFRNLSKRPSFQVCNHMCHFRYTSDAFNNVSSGILLKHSVT